MTATIKRPYYFEHSLNARYSHPLLSFAEALRSSRRRPPSRRGHKHDVHRRNQGRSPPPEEGRRLLARYTSRTPLPLCQEGVRHRGTFYSYLASRVSRAPINIRDIQVSCSRLGDCVRIYAVRLFFQVPRASTTIPRQLRTTKEGAPIVWTVTTSAGEKYEHFFTHIYRRPPAMLQRVWTDPQDHRQKTRVQGAGYLR